MLSINNMQDIEKMKKYYRASDMINLINFFPEISPIKNLTIIENEVDFLSHQKEIKDLNCIRVDSLKGRKIVGIEASGKKEEFLNILKRVKEIDPYGVLVLFNIFPPVSERYEKDAGISVGVDIGKGVFIDAVGKGFDGREVSKGICSHERYFIPWFDLRQCCIENFKQYQIHQINDEDYKKTRFDRIEFLNSIGLDYNIFSKYIPTNYEPIPDYIWLSVIKDILKSLEKKEEVLLNSGFSNFAISGNTEEKAFYPWQMYNTDRYLKNLKK